MISRRLTAIIGGTYVRDLDTRLDRADKVVLVDRNGVRTTSSLLDDLIPVRGPVPWLAGERVYPESGCVGGEPVVARGIPAGAVVEVDR